MKDVKITLRHKPLKGNKESLYLDYYPPITLSDGKSTRREFLKLYINTRPDNDQDREQNKENLKIAETIRARRILEYAEGKHGFIGTQTKKIDFFKYFEGFVLTEKAKLNGKLGNKACTLRHLQKYKPQGATVADVNEGFCSGFKTYLLNCDRLGINSKSIYLRALRAVLNQAVKERIFAYNPADNVKNIKTTTTEIAYLTKKELKELRKAECQKDILRTYFLFGCYTGLRHSDIITLTWGDIRKTDNGLTINKIMIKTQSTKKRAIVPLMPKALKLMGKRGKATETVFPKMALSSWTSKMLEDWIDAAGIDKHITFHCSRHTFATSLLSAGADIYTVSKLLGHSSIKMTERYAKVIDKTRNKAIIKLGKYF